MLRPRECDIDPINNFQEAYWRVSGKVPRISDKRDDYDFCFFTLEGIDSAQSYLSGFEKCKMHLWDKSLRVSQSARLRRLHGAVLRRGAPVALHLFHREKQ